jgi:hypothetical protein
MIYKLLCWREELEMLKHPLTVSEIRAELSLRFERINNNSNKDNGDNLEEMAFFGGQFKGKCRNCGKLDTSRSNVKIEEIKMVIITVAIQLVEFFVIIAASQDMSSKTVSNSRKGTHDSTITTLTPVTVILVIVIEKTLSHKTWFSRRHQMQRSLRMTFGFVIVVQVHTIVLRIEVCLMLKTSMRTFVLEMVIS